MKCRLQSLEEQDGPVQSALCTRIALDRLLASDASVANLCIDTPLSEVREYPPAAQRYGMPLLDEYGCFRTTLLPSTRTQLSAVVRAETTMMSQLKMANFGDVFTGSERFFAQQRNTHNFQHDFCVVCSDSPQHIKFHLNMSAAL